MSDVVEEAPARRSPVAAIAAYGAVLGAIAIVLFVTLVHGKGALDTPHLPWWAIAAAWVVAEACVVHLHFRRSRHSFSLADLPFVFALAFSSGDAFFIGALVGAAVAYGLRRLPPIKLGFNLAQLALAVCVAFAITRWIAVSGDATEPRTWLAIYAATLITGALSIACIAGVISIAEGGMSLAQVRQMFMMDGVVTAANSSIAVAAIVLIATDARVVIVLFVPTAIVFGVYRAYISERQRHEKLEFLYEANRALTRSPEVAEAIEGVLARSREAFRSEVAEVVLFSADGSALRTTYGPGEERITMVETDRDAAEELAALTDIANPVVALTPPYEPARLREHLERRADPPCDGRDAAGREPHDRHDHARQPAGDRARLQRRGPAATRAAGQQRQRRVAVRPPRAGRDQAAHAAGAAPPPGLPRPADRPSEPHAVHGARQGGARARGEHDRGALHRRRRLQGRQRLARALGRRRPAGVRGRPPAPLRAPAGRRRAPRRRRVRGHAARRLGPLARAADGRRTDAARLRGAGQRAARSSYRCTSPSASRTASARTTRAR